LAQRGLQELSRAGISLFSPSALPMLREIFGLNPVHSNRLYSHGEQRGGKADDTSTEWLDLVEMYSRSNVTKNTDKLMAISGMARKIFTRSKRTWCAGIWEDHLCASLLWFPTRDDLDSPTKSHAPSWSWVSWDGPIQFPLALKESGGSRFQSRCDFISLQSSTSPLEVRWLNGPGRLTLRGRLVPIKDLVIKHVDQLGPGPPRRGRISDGSDLPFLVLKNYVLVHVIEENIQNPKLRPVGWVALDCVDNLSGGLPTSTADFWFLILGTYNEHGSQAMVSSDTTILGIFLSSLDEERQLYKRVGAGQMSGRRRCHPIPLPQVIGGQHLRRQENGDYHD
jgi:hypothetical protein